MFVLLYKEGGGSGMLCTTFKVQTHAEKVVGEVLYRF